MGFFRIYTNICLEDALITYRYSENLALGRGFVFNAGERILGTTTPLFTMILGLLGAIIGVHNIPTASNVLAILAGLGAGLLIFAILHRLHFSRSISMLAMAIFYLHPDTFWTVTGGMETSLVIFFMVCGLYALSSNNYMYLPPLLHLFWS